MQVQDRVFILKKTRYGDNDLILNCLSSRGTRVGLFARSALKSKKRFGGGVLEPTHYVHVLYEDKTGSSGDQALHTLKEASLIQGFPGLRSEYERIDTGLFLMRLVNDVVKEGDIDSAELFNLLGNTLKAAETSSQLERLRTHFEAKLLANQGMLSYEEPVDEILARSPIADHERLQLAPEDWGSARVRLRRILQEYIPGYSMRPMPAL